MRRDDYTCKHCGLVGWERSHGGGNFTFPTRVDGVFLSIDHIIPKSRGGSHDESNLQVLCTTCNTVKGVAA